MSDFIKVAVASDLPDPGRQLVEVEDRIVALFHVAGQFYCIDDVCTHDGGPLSEGKLEDHAIACPRHGAKFDIRTGKALTMPATEDTVAHEVKVENGQVYVRINDGEPSSPPTAVAATSTAMPSAPAQAPSSPASAKSQPASIGTPPPVSPPADATPRELSEDLVREELKKVIDPELFVNIVDLGLIYNVGFASVAAENPEEVKQDVTVEMTLTAQGCPEHVNISAQVKSRVEQLPGVHNCTVNVVWTPAWTPERLSADAKKQLGIE